MFLWWYPEVLLSAKCVDFDVAMVKHWGDIKCVDLNVAMVIHWSVTRFVDLDNDMVIHRGVTYMLLWWYTEM